MAVKTERFFNSNRSYTLDEVRDNNGVYEEVGKPSNVVVSHNYREGGVLLYFDADRDTCERLVEELWEDSVFLKSSTVVTFYN